jgi:hypothetical protein
MGSERAKRRIEQIERRVLPPSYHVRVGPMPGLPGCAAVFWGALIVKVLPAGMFEEL